MRTTKAVMSLALVAVFLSLLPINIGAAPLEAPYRTVQYGGGDARPGRGDDPTAPAIMPTATWGRWTGTIRRVATDTATATSTPTEETTGDTCTPTSTATPTPTSTPTEATPAIGTSTPTSTATATLTATPTGPHTPTPTSTPTVTSTPTGTPTPTITPTRVPDEELICNGGFEATECWIAGNTPRPADYSTAQVRSGSRAMRLGITYQSDVQSYSSIYQEVTIPEDAGSAILSFWYYPLCQDDLPYDWQEVIIYSPAWGFLVRAMPQACSDSQTWTYHTFDLTPYAGQTIIVYFNVYNDGLNNLKTAMYLDDVSVRVWYQISTATSTATHTATATPTGTSPLTPTVTPTPTATALYRLYLPLIMKSYPAPSEARALWVTRWDYSDSEDVQEIVSRAAQANFNIILFQVRGVADAYYHSNYEPWAARLTGYPGTLGQDPGWDPLATAVELAHAAGLKLHAWVNTYPIWLTSSAGEAPPQDVEPQHLFWTLSDAHGLDDWRQWDEGGPMRLDDYPPVQYLYASPAVTLTATHIVSVCQDIVTNYEVDGLHLDHIRYAGPEFSHDPISASRFAEAQVLDPSLTWEDWQRAQVTDLVSQIYEQVVLPNQDVNLTAAVWPIYRDYWDWIINDGYDGYYQDSQGWMEAGVIDAISPMLYTITVKDYPDRFDVLVGDFVSHANGRQVWPGITADYASFDDIRSRIEIARQAGAAGHAIFSYSYINQRDYWDEFRDGPYAILVEVPPTSRK